MRMIKVVIVFVGLLAFGGCKESSSTVATTSEPITETNLFPLVKGRLFVYSEYSLDTSASQKIPATVHRRVTYVKDTVAFSGKNAFLLLDSIYTPAGTTASIETTYAAVENGDLWVVFNGTWLHVFQKSSNTNIAYNAGSYTDYSQGFPISVVVEATIRSKQTVTVPAGSISAYDLELVSIINLFTPPYRIPISIYFADGYGIIQQTTPVLRNPITGQKEQGEEFVLVSENLP